MMKKMMVLMMVLSLLLGTAAMAEEAKAPFTVTPPSAAKVTFTFEENPSTGFTWLCEIKNDGVVALSDSAFTAGKTDLVGAPGRHSFTLTAIGEGEAIVVFTYGRVWSSFQEKQLVYLVGVSEEGEIFVRDMTEELPMVGMVKDVTDEGVLIETAEGQEVLCHLQENMAAPEKDQYINIWFNGAMTMSLPGQISVLAWDYVEAMPR